MPNSGDFFDWEKDLIRRAREETQQGKRVPFTGSPDSLLARLQKEGAKRGIPNYAPDFSPAEARGWVERVKQPYDASKAAPVSKPAPPPIHPPAPKPQPLPQTSGALDPRDYTTQRIEAGLEPMQEQNNVVLPKGQARGLGYGKRGNYIENVLHPPKDDNENIVISRPRRTGNPIKDVANSYQYGQAVAAQDLRKMGAAAKETLTGAGKASAQEVQGVTKGTKTFGQAAKKGLETAVTGVGAAAELLTDVRAQSKIAYPLVKGALYDYPVERVKHAWNEYLKHGTREAFLRALENPIDVEQYGADVEGLINAPKNALKLREHLLTRPTLSERHQYGKELDLKKEAVRSADERLTRDVAAQRAAQERTGQYSGKPLALPGKGGQFAPPSKRPPKVKPTGGNRPIYEAFKGQPLSDWSNEALNEYRGMTSGKEVQAIEQELLRRNPKQQPFDVPVPPTSDLTPGVSASTAETQAELARRQQGLPPLKANLKAPPAPEPVTPPAEALSPEGFSHAPETPETPAPALETTPTFTKGNRVKWTASNGEQLTGTVRYGDHDGYTVDTDQIKVVNGVPIGRLETVHGSQLQPLESSSGFGQETPPGDEPVTAEPHAPATEEGLRKKITDKAAEESIEQAVQSANQQENAPSPSTLEPGSRVTWGNHNQGTIVGPAEESHDVHFAGPRLLVRREEGENIGEIISVPIKHLKNSEGAAVLPEPSAPVLESSQGSSAAPTEAEGVHPGTANLIRDLHARLSQGNALTNADLFNAATQHFGDTLASGKYDSRDVYDALEGAVNRWILQNGDALMQGDPKAALGQIRRLLDRLPTQTQRTKEQLDFQQFSTPPTQAFVAAKAAGITPNDVVLEPSAGVGGLASWAKSLGASTVANEISPRRRGLLQMLGFETQGVDAQHLDDLLPDHVQPTVILMNPPFSATGGKVATNSTKYGAQHVESALKRLAPGGRLVAIVGQGMRLDTPEKTGARIATGATFKPWWDKISQQYDVRANLSIPGDEYGKYGTTFGNNILVIDKTGPTQGANFTERLKHIRFGTVKSLEEALDVLRPITEARIATSAPAERPQGAGAVDANASDLPASGGRGRAEAGRGSELPGLGGAERGADVRPTGPSESPEPLPQGERERPLEDNGPVSTGGSDALDAGLHGGAAGEEPVHRGAVEAAPAQDPAVTDALRNASAEPDFVPEDAGVIKARNEALASRKEEGGEEGQAAFVEYVPAKMSGGAAHAGKVVETSTMAAVEPPDVNYSPKLAPSAMNPGAEELKKGFGLSINQLEAISYAGQQHAQRLPSGARAGYFVGDGTGTGKGRILSGIITDNWNRGVKRSLYVSISNDLIESTADDMKNIGAGDIPLHSILNLKKADDWNAKAPSGVIFTTYDSLVSKYDQIKKWLGDGVVILDEAHKAKNVIPTGRGGKPTQTGMSVIRIQRDLPDARFVYSSATGMTDVRNMAYMDRLGLWGPKTPFPTFTDFMTSIESGGVGAMEMVARDMKALGKYAARSLSFDGVEYKQRTHELSAEDRRMYDTAAVAWQTVMRNMDAAIEETGGGSSQKSFALSRFYASQQIFFSQLLMALKLPALVDEVTFALANDMAPVVSFINTGEARMIRETDKAISEGRDFEDMDLSPVSILRSYIEKSFPTQLYEDATDETTGNKVKRPVTDNAGNPVYSKEALRLKQRMLDSLTTLVLPESPLDLFLNHFGDHVVAEMTGRTKRLKVNPTTGKRELVKRGGYGKEVANDKLNLTEMDAFQSGRKKVALISGAASTGISLHASLRAKNQKRRYHITWQTDWSADKQMQFFGRTHRSHQASAPIYVLLSTDVGGETRFLSTIARRLESLGALTRGDRGAVGGDLSKFNFETPEGRAALERLISRMDNQTLLDMSLAKETKAGVEVKDDDTKNVPRFLNRLLALDLNRQNALFNEYSESFKDIVRTSKENGTFDEGVADIKGTSIRVADKETIHTHEGTGAETVHYTLNVDKPVELIPWSDVAESLKSDNAKGIYLQRKSGRIVFVQDSGNASNINGSVYRKMALTSPTSRRGESIPLTELETKFAKVDGPEGNQSESKALLAGRTPEEIWNEKYQTAPRTKTDELHVIGGAILPLWDRFKTTDAKMKVVRATADNGERVVGVLIDSGNVNKTLRAIGARGAGARSAAELWKDVLQGNEIELIGGLRLKLGHLRGSPIVEVVGAMGGVGAELARMGAKFERVNFVNRNFIPDEDTLEKVVSQYPVIEGEGIASLNAPQRGANTPSRNAQGRGATGPSAQPTTPRIPVDPIYGGENDPDFLNRSKAGIILDLTKDINRPYFIGHVKRNAAETYWPGDAKVTMRYEGDPDATAHGLAHSLDDFYHVLGPWAAKRTRSPFDDELIPHFSDHGSTRQGMTLAAKRAEGFAEWARAYAFNPYSARAAAPKLTKYVESKLPANIKAAILNFGYEVRRWEGLPPEHRIGSQFQMEPEAVSKLQSARAFLEKDLYRLFLDDKEPMWKALEELKGIKGISELPPTQDPKIRIRLLSSLNEDFENMLKQGLMHDLLAPLLPFVNGPATPKAVLAAMKEVVVGMASEQIVHQGQKDALAGIDPWGRKYIGADGEQSDYATAVEVVHRLYAGPPDRYQKFREAADVYREKADAGLRYMVDKGRLSPQQYAQYVNDHPYYLDTHRVLDDFGDVDPLLRVEGSRNVGRAPAASKRVIQHKTGSAKRVVNPYANLLRGLYERMVEADRNEAMRTFTDLLVSNRKMYQGQVMDLSRIGFEVAASQKGKPNVVEVFYGGKPRYFRLDPDVYRAAKGVFKSVASIPGLASASRLWRNVLTHSLPFMGRNVFKDTLERGINTRTEFHLSDMNAMFNPAAMNEFFESGGGMFGFFAHDKASFHKLLKEGMVELTRDPHAFVWKPLARYHDLGRKSELINRIAEFQAAKRVGLKKWGNLEDARLFAAHESQDLLPFAVAGEVTRWLNQIYPFTNAQVQANVRFLSSIRHHPGRVFAIILGISAIGIALQQFAFSTGHGDDYDALPPWKKMLFWNIPLSNGGFISIPKGHVAAILSSIPELTADRFQLHGSEHKANPHAFEGLAGQLTNTVIPDVATSPLNPIAMVPGVLRPPLSLYANRNALTGAPIVSQYEQKRLVQDRKGAGRASRLGKGLVAPINALGGQADPRQADYLIRSYGGGFGNQATSLSDVGRSDRVQTLADLIGNLTGLVARPPMMDSPNVQAVYDLAGQLGRENSPGVRALAHLRDAATNPNIPPVEREAARKQLLVVAALQRTVLEKQKKERLRRNVAWGQH